MTPRRLYIIGNGFDLHHDIDSGFKNFYEFLIDRGVITKDDYMEKFFTENDLWSSFEENLGRFDINRFTEEQTHAALIASLSSHLVTPREYATELLAEYMDGIRMALPGWLTGLRQPNPAKKINLASSSALFLNFNYTTTLEDLYGIDPSQIIHIHGKIGQSWEKLLLGHGGVETLDTPIEYSFDDCYTRFALPREISLPSAQDTYENIFYLTRKYDEWRKPVNETIVEKRDFFLSLEQVKIVNVFGFSFSSVDMPYINAIRTSIAPNAIWQASWHKDEDKNRIYDHLGKRCRLVRLEHLM